ncbi:MAG: transcription antitermination factor NusB [Deltaproteobacteria bacterium RIFCSPLOWO2_12_FULL_43_16]|nr:MAG: transcription antitermination factor NusB [Deltaproteobacteria bacterium GWA2_43_19]OGQ10667.1 MAG: transcription antitermination factor NusB [Deltaproteobacteria bacterium RIFCSPHIGHO2_02_FULL_43_33]OGQ58648.1 MAG: transcription antitermination factor NusB [Deltaproteobacteria bacterium RIFCSPLOWO2_12_FULL_43_16]HBR17626.1 transcription antitermination factor NusB [Deltaproteobacteria bacterium]
MKLSRRKARIIALEMLYQLDMADGGVDNIIDAKLGGKNFPQNTKDFILRLARGFSEHKDEIDRFIKKGAENWSIDRITAVDRNILRLAIFELLYCQDVPFKVIIDEAVELAKLYGAEDSGAFINGVLDKIGKGISSRKQEMREIA